MDDHNAYRYIHAIHGVCIHVAWVNSVFVDHYCTDCLHVEWF